MTVSLKNRQVQIPGGLQFRIPEVGFIAPPFQSFDVLVSAVLRVVLANPNLATKFRWPNTKAGVEMWVDRVNATICQQNGWKDYITVQQDLEPPKFSPPSGAHPLEAVVAGVKSIAEWFGDGMDTVPPEKAGARGTVCVKCPLNHPGDFGNWFTRQASEVIRKRIASLKGLNLVTASDEKLGVCQACMCPLKLKIHFPISYVLNNIPADSKLSLDKDCWILSEEKCPTLSDKVSSKTQ